MTEPFAWLQLLGTATALAVNSGGSVMFTPCDDIQPFASITITLYDVAVKPVPVLLLPLVVVLGGVGAQLNVYGPVPPAPVTVAEPVLPPKHATLVCVCDEVSCVGCVMLKVCEPVHPFASVTIATYVPAVKPVAVLVFPFVVCVTAGFHVNVNGPVPPTAWATACPVLPPKHKTFVGGVLAMLKPPPPLTMVTVTVVV